MGQYMHSFLKQMMCNLLIIHPRELRRAPQDYKVDDDGE